MKVAILISSLGLGGAQRVVSIASGFWARKGWNVRVLTLSGSDVLPFYDLDKDVEWAPLDVARLSTNPVQALMQNARRIRVIRHEVARSRPDILISFMDTTNILALLATRGLGIPVVVADRNNPVDQKLGTFWQLLRDSFYQRAEAVVVQTARAMDCYPLPVRTRCVLIPNSLIPVQKSTDDGGIAVPGPALVGMGRLTVQKGFDLLLETFASLLARHSEWNLVIVGEGPDRQSLERQANELGIRDRVLFTGRIHNPERVLRQCDVFVLSSRYEGFPNALCEAMACGLPAVSFDCPFGPTEIIRDGVDGVLVPHLDLDAMKKVLDRLMDDPSERERLSHRAPEVVARFGLERVMGMWDDILAHALRECGHV